MTSLLCISDVHVGVMRSAGTTPTTAWLLRQHILEEFAQLVSLRPKDDLLINGDLFDTNTVPMVDWLGVFRILDKRLRSCSTKVYCSLGNHDAPRTSTTLSSFGLLCKVLTDLHPKNFVAVLEPMMTPHGYIIPHVANQDLFGLELSKVPPCSTVFLHCNYASPFAQHSDQSLNLSEEQAAALPVKHIVIAHEHQMRQCGKVLLPGNQIASSVSDWLGAEDKYMAVVKDGVPELHALDRKGEFVRMSWKDLYPSNAKFIRVEGKATAEEATAVLSAISKYRAKSDAFVITNAVQIDTNGDTEEFSQALESVKAFDVMAALKEVLTPEEWAVVESLE